MRGAASFRLGLWLPAAWLVALSWGGAALVSELGCASPAVAQDTASPAPAQGHRRFGQILLSLNLSDQQKAQIRAIMQNARQQSQNADRETRRANMQAAFKKIDGVLTPAQSQKLHAKLDAMRKERDQSSQQQ
jgi:Spy/CpxP family protein refolding chaperone